MPHFKSLKRVSLIIMGGLSLSACGFTPMHAPNALSSTNALPLQQISLEVKDGRDAKDKEVGFYLQQRLRDRIGTNEGSYVLTITPEWRRGGLGISSEDIASRFDGTVRAQYVLSDKKSGEVLDKGRIEAVSTFGASRDAYGVIAANDNAMQNTAAQAADRLIVELASYFASNKDLAVP